VYIPPGHTEASVIEAVNTAADKLARAFVFGPYELADIKQHCWICALKALPSYEPRLDDQGRPTRPLVNFIYTDLKFKLINLKRDELRRTDPPCELCHSGQEAAHEDGEVCKAYRLWKKRNNAKASLAQPLCLNIELDESEASLCLDRDVNEEANKADVLDRIDQLLPAHLRTDYLRMKSGDKVPSGRKDKVMEAIRLIVGAQGVAAA
jgi:hypothetical protein